jgi:hypothetical protein
MDDPMKKWQMNWTKLFSNEKSKWIKKTHEEMLSITGHEGTANQNHVNILPQSCWNSYHQEQKQQQTFVRMWGKRNSYTLLVEM